MRDMPQTLKRPRRPRCVLAAAVLFLACACGVAVPARGVTYHFAGEVTRVFTNQQDAIPGLTPGDTFTGQVVVPEWPAIGLPGRVQVSVNGVSLQVVGGEFFADSGVDPDTQAFWLNFSATTFGEAQAPSTFTPVTFGPVLGDTDGSAGLIDPLPPALPLAQFEANRFVLQGVLLAGSRSFNAEGVLTYFGQAPAPEPATGLTLVVAGLMARRRR